MAKEKSYKEIIEQLEFVDNYEAAFLIKDFKKQIVRSKNKIKKQIKIHKTNLENQVAHAKKMKGDGHELSREKAIILLKGMIAGLKWVLS